MTEPEDRSFGRDCNELVTRLNEQRDEIESLRAMLTGWSGHAWKDGVYVDDIQAFFDGGSEEE